jgi:hypothetical protein
LLPPALLPHTAEPSLLTPVAFNSGSPVAPTRGARSVMPSTSVHRKAVVIDVKLDPEVPTTTAPSPLTAVAIVLWSNGAGSVPSR